MIRSMLSTYECEVKFTKVNGDERTMRCSLMDEHMPASSMVLKEDVTDIPVDKNNAILTVWCTDVGAWRAMRVMNVLTVKLPPKSWTVTLEEADDGSGDLVMPLPQELLDMQGWKEGDSLKWEDGEDGSWFLKKE